MDLSELLKQYRSSILGEWFTVVATTYPEETAKFLKRQKDRFANPVGAAIKTGLEGLFDQLAGVKTKHKEPNKYLDGIIRVRAIQEFSPSQAVDFVFKLKDIIRSKLGEKIAEGELWRELDDIDKRVDALALTAFDIYVSCRQQVFEIKANEVKSFYAAALRRADMLVEQPETAEPDIDNTNPQAKPETR